MVSAVLPSELSELFEVVTLGALIRVGSWVFMVDSENIETGSPGEDRPCAERVISRSVFVHYKHTIYTSETTPRLFMLIPWVQGKVLCSLCVAELAEILECWALLLVSAQVWAQGYSVCICLSLWIWNQTYWAYIKATHPLQSVWLFIVVDLGPSLSLRKNEKKYLDMMPKF